MTAEEAEKPKIYPVEKLEASQIVDTNGAGDAFAGGFIGAYVSGKSLDECVLAGHKLAAICVQQVNTATVLQSKRMTWYRQVGPQYKWPKVQIL